MSDSQEQRTRQGAAIGLIALGVAARFAPHPPNVSPLAAMALFGGTYLSRGWAIGVPLASVVLSDLVMGLHEVIAFTWGSVALTGLVGWWVRQHPSARRLVLASCLASTLFFVATNFGVWWLGENGTMYPKTLEGLVSCYTAALPFFRNTLLGDLAWTAGLFGLYAWSTKSRFLPGTSRAH